MDKQRLASRVLGRNFAKEVLLLVDFAANPEAVDAFLDELNSLRKKEPITPQKKRKLRELAATKLEFGIHAGVPLSDVPRDYLLWLQRSSEETTRLITEYLELTPNETEEEEDPL